jgi:hypothetical protein
MSIPVITDLLTVAVNHGIKINIFALFVAFKQKIVLTVKNLNRTLNDRDPTTIHTTQCNINGIHFSATNYVKISTKNLCAHALLPFF